MHGLVFVTWENYLGERFGSGLLHTYREQVRHTPAEVVLASKFYDDEALLAGVAVAHQLTHTPVDTLLREFGQHFMLDGLASRLCEYLLTRVHSARDLLLAMGDAHAQMSATGVTPPLFKYRLVESDPAAVMVVYESARKLCPLLLGAIAGAAMRYGEQAQVYERTCMRRGDAACQIIARFSPAPTLAEPEQDAERQRQQAERRQLADRVYSLLPDQDGMTLPALQVRLRDDGAPAEQVRPFILLQALGHLHHAGWCANSANQPGDVLGTRRYWRLPRVPVQ
ncbi:MAG TPA: heme NO-binding domain-containing protein [Ktedonobacterales bacterium]|jgi:hypothetical protein